ncbi:hypothetical protein PL11_005035 [Lentilactobacillus curieae]|uniref:Integral membrane protein n=1 Tax=Lentilactobacillus curieae TaxID=1138822 RepID=A0A1S6QIA3_9LACO|nr:YitT family protein [Lentilactobacillus curieae]AQW21337.1 hypothetical protein PL11_005035 [Lentilactobacillus curieae]
MDKDMDVKMQPVAKRDKAVILTNKTIMSFVGILILSMGESFLQAANLGMDPFTGVNIGFSNLLHMGLGNFQLIMNLIIFLFVVFANRKMIGIGTVLNMVLVGYEIQFFSGIYSSVFGTVHSLPLQIVNALIGLIIFTFGASMYMMAQIGVAPYDGVAPILSEWFHVRYRVVRIIQDIIFMAIAFFVGGPFGFVTIIIAFFTGPLIEFWNDNVNKKIFNKIQSYKSR